MKATPEMQVSDKILQDVKESMFNIFIKSGLDMNEAGNKVVTIVMNDFVWMMVENEVNYDDIIKAIKEVYDFHTAEKKSKAETKH